MEADLLEPNEVKVTPEGFDNEPTQPLANSTVEEADTASQHVVLARKLTQYPDWQDISNAVDIDEYEPIVYISDLKQSDPTINATIEYLEACNIDFRVDIISANEMNKRVEERSMKGGISGLKVESDTQQEALNLFTRAANLNASDIHLQVNSAHTEVEFRLNGDLERQTPITKELGELMIGSIINSMLSDGASLYKANERQDGRISSPKYLPSTVGSIRVAYGPIEGDGRLLVLRLLYKDTNDISGGLEHRLEVLGYSQKLIKLIRAAWDKPSGINLLSGPTGSGKSTTLKHILECKKTEHPEENFISIEDPPEYRIEGVRQISAEKSQFSSVINFSLRADPDKMLVGEIRDASTLSMAVKVALSGHGVSASVHANSAFGIMKRLVDMMRSAENPEPIHTLADETVITGLVFQRLVKINCPHCSIPFEHTDAHAGLSQRLKSVMAEEEIQRIRMINPQGCEHKDCDKGAIGREVVAEVVLTNDRLMEVLRTKGDYEAKRYWQAQMEGMTIVDHALEKILEGKLSPEIAEKAVGPLNENSQRSLKKHA